MFDRLLWSDSSTNTAANTVSNTVSNTANTAAAAIKNNINYDYDDEHFKDELTFDRLLPPKKKINLHLLLKVSMINPSRYVLQQSK